MRVVATADLHGDLPNINAWPDGDVLVLAGDTCFLERNWRRPNSATFAPMRSNEWLGVAREKYTHIVGIAGNHDFAMESAPTLARGLDWTYLQDEEIVIDGFKFYGTPWSKTFLNWAFMKPDD